MRVLVTGATGYIGGRLVPRLLERGHTVRVLVRDPERIAGRAWADRVEVVAGDLLDPAGLRAAFAGIDAAYYLVHSMDGSRDFAAKDAAAARNFVTAGQEIGLRHTLYLGGILPQGDDRVAQLRSAGRGGRICAHGLPATELRGTIIGSGSASFEMVRYLTERLPAMIAPRWG